MTMENITNIFQELNFLSHPIIFNLCNSCCKIENMSIYQSKLENCLIHHDYFTTENDRFISRGSSKKDLEDMKILEKFKLNDADINDTAALYLVKWKNKNFSKYTLIHSFLIDNIVYLRVEKLQNFNNYRYFITDFNPSINLSKINLLNDRFTNQVINKEMFFDMFSKGDVFVPFKFDEDYKKFRDFIIELIINIRRKVNYRLI